jgi:hypothetical protein
MSDWARLGMEWTEVGTVSRTHGRGFQLAEFGNRWFNISRYHPGLPVPAVGQRVEIWLDETGCYVNAMAAAKEENGV